MNSQLDELSLSAHLFAGSAKMEDDGFDPLAHEDDYVGTQAWQSQTQHAGTSRGRGGFDLNSHAGICMDHLNLIIFVMNYLWR